MRDSGCCEKRRAAFACSRSHFEGIAPCVDACDAVPPFSTKNVTYPRSISRSGTDFSHILALSSKNGAYFQCFLLNMDKKAAIDAWKEPATQQKLKQEPVRLGNASIRDLLHLLDWHRKYQGHAYVLNDVSMPIFAHKGTFWRLNLGKGTARASFQGSMQWYLVKFPENVPKSTKNTQKQPPPHAFFRNLSKPVSKMPIHAPISLKKHFLPIISLAFPKHRTMTQPLRASQ